MDALQRFQAASLVLRPSAGAGGPSVWTVMAMAAVDALPRVSAAVICVLGADPDSRVCVGGSDGQALRAEQLEFTTGAGPGFDAHRTGRPVVANSESLRVQFPVYLDALQTSTSLVAVQVLPVSYGQPTPVVLLMLWYSSGEDLRQSSLADVAAVADAVGWAAAEKFDGLIRGLRYQTQSGTGAGRGSGTYAELQPRAQVNVASGMVMAALRVDRRQSMDLLRSYAWARGHTLDHIAGECTAGRLAPDLTGP